MLSSRVRPGQRFRAQNRREHDRHEEVGQENTHHRDPTELEENQNAKKDGDCGIETQDGMRGEFLQDGGAGEAPGKETKKPNEARLDAALLLKPSAPFG